MYALINPDNELTMTHDFVDEEIPNTKADWKWIPVVADPRPDYNPETQVATLHEDIEQSRVYRYWTVRDKLPYELDSDKIQKINAIDPTIMAALLDLYNTINTPVTLDQYKEHLKSII